MQVTDFNRRRWLQAAGVASLAVTAAPAFAEVAKTPDPGALANLSLNENPWGPSPAAHQAMLDHLGRVNRYANIETHQLQQMIAEQEGVSPDMVIIAPGSNQILRTLGDLYIADKPGGELITAEATFEVQWRAVMARGGKVVAVPFDSAMRYDVDAMASKINANTAGFYICNPNNPTGTMVEPGKLRAFVIDAAKKAPVFIDEAYIDLTDDYPRTTMIDLVRSGHNVIVCRTFSKLHGLAAARCGYAVLPAAMAAKVRGVVSSGGLPRLAVVAAIASLQDKTNQVLMKARLKRGREQLIKMADALKLTYAPGSQANFIYVKTGMTTKEFTAAMRARGVLVVQRGFNNYDDWNRICVGYDDEIDRCKTALKDVLRIA